MVVVHTCVDITPQFQQIWQFPYPYRLCNPVRNYGRKINDMICYDMIWYDMIWYDMIYDMIYMMMWYDMIWYDMIRYDMIRYDTIRYDMIWYDTIYDMIWYDTYLLSVTGLTPGGSSTVHIYKQTIHRTTQLKTSFERLSEIRTQRVQNKISDELRKNYRLTWKSAGRALRVIPWYLLYNWEKKNGKTSVWIAEECQLNRILELK